MRNVLQGQRRIVFLAAGTLALAAIVIGGVIFFDEEMPDWIDKSKQIEVGF